MKIVGLVGPKRVGKSTAADVLVRERGFVSIGFADALKDLAVKVNPDLAADVQEFGWEVVKGLSNYRWFLQEFGTRVRDIDSSFWIRAWRKATLKLSPDACVVVPDVRFLNEAQAIKAFDESLLIRITRPGLDSSDTHVSETEQLGIQCDAEITNVHVKAWFEDDVLATVDLWMETGSVDAEAV